MREALAAALVLSAGCGRIGFDPRHDAAAATEFAFVNATTGANGGDQLTVTTAPQLYKSGDLLVALVHLSNSGDQVVAMSDDAGNLFESATGSLRQISGLGVQTVEIWYANDIVGAPADSVTASFSGASTASIIIREYSGANASQPFETAVTGVGAGAVVPGGFSITTASFAPAAAGNLNVAFAVSSSPVGAGSWEPGAGYELGTNEPVLDMQSEELLDAPAGTQTATIVYTAAGNMLISVASFKP